jgi:hypothetical protein
MSPNCQRCNVPMQPGQALVNTISGADDFGEPKNGPLTLTHTSPQPISM